MRRDRLTLATAIILLATVVTPGEAQYFGKNKVQYRSFDWVVLESDHFEVYYYQGERKIAVDGARIAERAYSRLSAVLDHEFEEKIPLIIYASHTDFQMTNVSPGHIGEGTQGVTELMKRRVFLPFTGSYSEFRHVLEHELVHAFQLDMLMGRGEATIGNPMSFVPPLWWMEGMAEYLSMLEVDHHTEMWLRDASLQGYLVPVESMAYVGDIRVYRFGQAILAYIGERFGDTKIGDIHRAASRLRSLDRAIEDVLGLSVKRFSEDWTQHVRRTYMPAIADHLKPQEFSRRLTQGAEDLSNFNLAASVDPSGRRFVFISDRSLYNDLYLASAIDGEVETRLIKGERTGSFEALRFLYTSIAWSPDGTRVALSAKDRGQDVVVVYDVDKRKEVIRLRPELDGILSPSFSPDGTAVVFNGLKEGYSDVYTMNLDGSDLRRLTASRNAARDPVWSPDGKWIAFTTDLGGSDVDQLDFNEYRIALYDVDAGEVTIPDGQVGKCITPQWTADSRRLLFVSDRTGISNIYVMDVDGGDVRQLTNILSGVSGITDLSPSISLSADGSRLLFTAFAQGGFDVYAMDYPLGVPEGDEEHPAPEAWIVDGRGLPGENLGEVTAAKSGQRADPEESTSPDSAGTPDLVDPLTATESDELLAVADPAGDESTRSDAGGRVADADAGGGGVADADADADAAERRRRSIPLMAQAPRLGRPGELGASSIYIDEEGNRTHELPDSTAFTYRDYKLDFSPDFVAANGLFASSEGVAAQTAIGFSDVLGNHQIVVGASVYGSLADADLFMSYANLSRRTNWGVSLFQYRSDFVLAQPDQDGDTEYVSQIHRGLEFAVSRPFDRFRRLELSLGFQGIEERIFGSTFLSAAGPTSYIDLPGDGGSRFLVRPSLALVTDNVVYGSTGPISGRRSRYEVDVAVGGVDFTTFFVDHRRYLNLRQRYVLALRGIGASSLGENPQGFRIGGSYTLRGYDFGAVSGENMLLANLEFRYPLIDFVKLGWPLPLAFQGIRGILFLDAGTAWDDNQSFKPIGGDPDRDGFYLNDIKASYGFGVRMNVFGFLIARWDLARKTDLDTTLGPWVGRFALGAEY
jgi:Tol biopolymer transport system component